MVSERRTKRLKKERKEKASFFLYIYINITVLTFHPSTLLLLLPFQKVRVNASYKQFTTMTPFWRFIHFISVCYSKMAHFCIFYSSMV